MSVVPHHNRCLASKWFFRYLSSFSVLFVHFRGLSQIVHVWLHISNCLHDFTFPFDLYSQFLDGLHQRLVGCLRRRNLTIVFQWCGFQHCGFRWLDRECWAFWLHMNKLVTCVTCTYKFAPFQNERSCTNNWIIWVKVIPSKIGTYVSQRMKNPLELLVVFGDHTTLPILTTIVGSKCGKSITSTQTGHLWEISPW